MVHQFTANLDLLYNKDGLPTKNLKGTKSIKHIPPTFYNLTSEERGNQLREWIKAGRKDLFHEFLRECEREYQIEHTIIRQWVEKVHKEWETEREIAQYESIPDGELEILKKAFKHRHCFNDRNGINQFNGLQTCPIRIYGKE